MALSARDDGVNELVGDIVRGLSAESCVAAVAVLGSSATSDASETSDVDLFVYSDAPAHQARRALAEQHADASELVLVGNGPFGEGDVWRHEPTGLWVDLMVWTPAWADGQLDRCLVEHRASLGYSTAFWSSIATADAVHERDGWHARLQERAASAYPDELVSAIVELNMPWLRGHPFSFRNQVAKAVARDDRVSVNHRLAAWAASYFDVLFAVNRVLHPGREADARDRTAQVCRGA